ncbi:hypothetical protein EVAR_44841_1 [Eumeta japonica]|uniref:Uncharacterized protein n=1 Tax=Eumeta variegata TaxID=151549 RepID=A0A4C1YN41_EUMVA|nr:hypothetical protein EVAR_44841_1 [Eumeta japonica]
MGEWEIERNILRNTTEIVCSFPAPVTCRVFVFIISLFRKYFRGLEVDYEMFSLGIPKSWHEHPLAVFPNKHCIGNIERKNEYIFLKGRQSVDNCSDDAVFMVDG